MKPLRIQGLPVHPALVHFPVAGWTAATLLLFAGVLGAGEAYLDAAHWCNVAGLLTGVAAMAAGFVELVALPARATARDAVIRHMLFAASAWTLYLLALLAQVKGAVGVAAAAALAGFVLLLLAGHAGAQLVYPHGLPEHASPSHE